VTLDDHVHVGVRRLAFAVDETAGVHVERPFNGLSVTGGNAQSRENV
jgi:hypothetical protein